MKLLIDSRSINLHSGSGIGTYTKNLVSNLLDIDKNDNFNLIWTGNELDEYNRSNVDITHISGRYGGFYEAYYIPNLIKNKEIELYHIPQNGIGFPFDYNLNVVVTIHDLIPFIMPETVGIGYLNRFLKDMPKIIEYTKGIITVSEFSKRDILRFFPSFPEEKIFVTPLATNTQYKPLSKNHCKKYLKENYQIEGPYILYVGGFSKRKNVKALITSFASIHKDLKKPHKLLIAGSLRDEGELLKTLVNSLGLQDTIIFTGYLPDEVLPIFYSGSEAFVYPSLYEGFGLPPLEAMSCRTPVITSNLTSIPEVTSDSALLIDPLNSDELEYSLLKLLNDESLKEEFREKGYKKSLQFSWTKTAQKTIEAYNSLVNI
ncbi:glycosyltransferase family 4 protein [Clostridium sp. SHJSY1]|uniref:glycosyltransferase family 4 protein n=1 Tax=Clostridium sp. SHJSY1 TaxID=2942483 RepID=UPI00287723EA|nr:glycosyltransferase family 1 protein [Clostridium sp. SHJSY1]MDS0528119.1 glycosyltransferase family 4 protein [Clostridium sp. SHJSY1]